MSGRAARHTGPMEQRISLVTLGVEDLTRAISLDPTAPEAFYERGKARQFLEKLEAAVADFDEAIAREPWDHVDHDLRTGRREQR